ncbi:protocadherin-18b isoform X2 [Poecilia latipinna]|uniref:protocadherin-18b isoform X2 n=1 Tax=Poecilia formosa TaxID=48698 RepID=UPI000443A107|nr:PREDICTED: protocadherin-18-like isoform X2 [Poecilia formosa]XP_014903466.1 PREDICTED: protocadherin-18-like isoform X2 [Poecilia latipinna]
MGPKMIQAKGNVNCTIPLALLLLLVALLQGSTGKTLKYKVYEEQRVGTVIARLKEDVAGVLSKLPNSLSFRFRAMQRGSTQLLSVREEDGEISIGTKIDREKLCEKNLNCSIEFDVVTLPTEYLQLFHVEVEVLDINDNSPHFSRAIVPIEISESASVGTRIPLDGAVDADVGENSLHTYSLTPNNFFKIDVRTRTDGAKYAELVVMRELDREVQSSYQLQLTASDNGVPPKSGSTLLKISISDSNDNSPAFDEQAYVINLLENSPLGTLIIDLNATDPDEGTNGKIVYSFSSHVSPKILEAFKINPENGHITLIKKVDYETTASYELDVQAQDLGPNSIPGLCKIVVKVVDVNDNKPEININLMTPGKEEVAYISEGAPVDTFIALVRVDDMDAGLNGEVVCRLHGHGHFRLQKTHEKNYMILTNVSLDREKRSEYSLTVMAEDKGSPSLSTIKHFTVQVLDENDNPPHFEKSRYEVFKSENNSPGAYLMTVVASDPDLGTNGQVTYTIIDAVIQASPISTYVTIDPSNGAIYALRSFDHEDVSRVAFTVQARDGGNSALSANTTVLLTVLDENDNPPIIHSPSLRNHTAELPVWKYASPGQLISTLKITDRDSGANGEVSCTIVGGNEDGLFVMDARRCELRTNASLEQAPRDVMEIRIEVQDRGTSRLTTGALFRLSLQENMDILPPLYPTGSSQASLDLSLIVIISLGAVCALLLVVMVMFATARCSREKKDPRHNYNCRVAENSYQNHPKKPARQIHKADITLVPTVNGTLPVRSHPRSPLPSPTPERGTLGSRHSHHSRQSLNSLVTISSNHVAENFALELAHATPPVEGQYQPRPSFRGNKYTRSYRYALNEMDKFSLKDSGRGDSEAGDSDYEPGRESPVDRLLGEAFTELYSPDGQHCSHAAMKLCTEECRVLGHSDQCWMPPLGCPASSSADYRSNLYIPGEEAHQATDITQEKVPQPCTDTCTARNQSFSTFGKDLGGEDGAEEDGLEGGSKSTDEDLCGTTSLLSEMSSVFQRLLPQGLDSYVQVNENQRGTSLSGVGVPMTGSLDRRRGHLPGKPSPSVHQQGVAAWAANTHFQNPGSSIGPSGQHQGGSYHTLKANTKLSCQSSNHKGSQAPKNSPQNSGHNPKPTSSPLLSGLVSPTLVQTSLAQPPVQATLNGPSSKWLPAMEEIPENYEEDDFDSVLSHLQGKRSDSRHELVDASELVAEINKLLQDVRQT